MYFVQFKKYPAKIEDLENTNNKRFLRRRYIDPMTGKDEWRLVHVNGMGQLTDSLVQKPPSPSGASGASGAEQRLAMRGLYIVRLKRGDRGLRRDWCERTGWK